MRKVLLIPTEDVAGIDLVLYEEKDTINTGKRIFSQNSVTTNFHILNIPIL